MIYKTCILYKTSINHRDVHKVVVLCAVMLVVVATAGKVEMLRSACVVYSS